MRYFLQSDVRFSRRGFRNGIAAVLFLCCAATGVRGACPASPEESVSCPEAESSFFVGGKPCATGMAFNQTRGSAEQTPRPTPTRHSNPVKKPLKKAVKVVKISCGAKSAPGKIGTFSDSRTDSSEKCVQLRASASGAESVACIKRREGLSLPSFDLPS